MNQKNKKKNYCINCGCLCRNKYCSLLCQKEYAYKTYIQSWKSGCVDGIIGDRWKELSRHVRRYIFEKYNFKCAMCGWNKTNVYTGSVPLEIDHIDGDVRNNKEENLILLCPNCHSLTSTYRGANRGKGKRTIKWVSREIA